MLEYFKSENSELNPTLIKTRIFKTVLQNCILYLYLDKTLAQNIAVFQSISFIFCFNFCFSSQLDYTSQPSTKEEIGTVCYFNLMPRLYKSKVVLRTNYRIKCWKYKKVPMIYNTEIIAFNSIPYMQPNFSVTNSYVHPYTQKNTAWFLLTFLTL